MNPGADGERRQAGGTGPGHPYALDAGEMRVFLYLSFAMLALGGIFGTLQALDKMGVDLYRYLAGPFRSYYLGLTVHGVTIVLLFTTLFILGFFSFVTVHGLRRPLQSRALSRVSLWLMVGGVILTLIPMFRNDATVLWTFYAPLRAHPLFYAGLGLVVVATWVAALNTYLTWRAWKREHPGERTPLMTFTALVTWTMWVLASLGVAVGVLFFLFPWSLGLSQRVNPLLTRSLFWFTGHPVVYLWLLPAYTSWYTMLPAQVGGRLFSESLARLVFLLFIPFAIPTGLHHMYADPGVTPAEKLFHGVLTYAVVFPSLLTAFTVLASVEDGARRNGGRGWLGWVLVLPWFSNPSVAGQLLAMVLFATGGITGIIQASYNMNLLVHNSLWVPGHLHTMVGTAVTLTFMAVSYWLLPFLTGRALWRPGLAVAQVWTWFLGMAAMGRGMHWMGLAGVPRRTFLSQAPYAVFQEWQAAGLLVGTGGVLLFVSGVLFLWIVLKTARNPEPARVTVPEAQPLYPVERMPRLLDRLTPWVALTLLLVAVAWFPPLYRIVTQYPLTPGWRLW